MSASLASRRQPEAVEYKQLSMAEGFSQEEICDAVSRSRGLIRQHPQLQHNSHLLEFEIEGNHLIISGQLPSYFQKQLAQEAIRGAGNFVIENRIVVGG